MPKHGAVRQRYVHVLFHFPARSFEARNGEGRIVLEGREELPEERRYCSKCKVWIHIRGLLSYFYNNLVGCEKCGVTFPARSKAT